jgi:hypothetical protein
MDWSCGWRSRELVLQVQSPGFKPVTPKKKKKKKKANLVIAPKHQVHFKHRALHNLTKGFPSIGMYLYLASIQCSFWL